MSENNPTVFVSDEISSTIDMDQFYEATDGTDFIVSFWSEGMPVTGKLTSLKIKGNHVRLTMLASSSFFFSFVSGSSIKNLAIFREGSKKPDIEYKNITVVSKSIKLDSVEEHEYDLFVKIENM